MGFALLPAILGPSVLPIVVAAGMSDLLVVVSAALALDSLAQKRPGGALGAIAGALARVARNPLIWAIVAGGAFSAAGLAPPRMPMQLVRLLGDAAVPVALFTIGVSLYRPGTRWEWAEVLAIAGVKLLAHPLLVALVAAYLFRLAPLEVAALTLSAALPVAGTVFLFAERAGANGERIAAAILVSTACAFFSFSALVWLLAAWAPAPIK
jgi:predicted permease